VTYAGATGRALAPDVGLALPDHAYGWQLKHDGQYAEATTDVAGRLASLVSRTGAPIRSDLIGIPTGASLATFAGELDAHTEAGTRLAATRGYACLHLFDCLAFDGVPCADVPYDQRHALLYRAHSLAESAGTARRRSQRETPHGARSLATGRYAAPETPRDLRRLPVVPLIRGRAAAAEAWRAVEREGCEGLVAVALRAPAGKRGAKLKIKTVDTLDCPVLYVDHSGLVLTYGGHRFSVPMSAAQRAKVGEPRVGGVVEVACFGWYETTTTPRMAKVVRVRADLSTTAGVQ
jgi:hypothetical protein